MSESRVLFCPFCREHFEGQERCPTHELGLVPFSELGDPIDGSRDEIPLPLHSLRFGRGSLFTGALLTLIACVCPLASMSGQVSMSGTLLRMAHGQAAHLWLVPIAAAAQLSILYRRRSPAALRGARLVVLLLSLLPSGLVAVTLVGVHGAAALMTERMRSAVDMHIGVGAWLVWLAALPMLRAATKLGAAPARRVQV